MTQLMRPRYSGNEVEETTQPGNDGEQGYLRELLAQSDSPDSSYLRELQSQSVPAQPNIPFNEWQRDNGKYFSNDIDAKVYWMRSGGRSPYDHVTALPAPAPERPSIAGRAGKQLANRAVLEDIEQARPSTTIAKGVPVLEAGLQAFESAEEEDRGQLGIRNQKTGRVIPWYKLPGVFADFWWDTTKEYYFGEKSAQSEAAIRETRGDVTFDVPPAETVGEKITDAGAGLTAFLARLVAIKSLTPKDIPASLRGAVMFEMENAASGGVPGQGAMLGGSLQGISQIPVKGLQGELVKMGAESALFAGLAAAEPESDAVDILIAAAIPPALRGTAFARADFRARLRAARTPDEVASVIREANFFADKHAEAQRFVENASPETLQRIRSRFEGRDDPESRGMIELIDAKLRGDVPVDVQGPPTREQATAEGRATPPVEPRPESAQPKAPEPTEPLAPPMRPAGPATSDPSINLGGAGTAITENLYRSMYTRLVDGNLPEPFTAGQQSAFAIEVKKAFEEGKIHSWEDIQQLANPTNPSPVVTNAPTPEAPFKITDIPQDFQPTLNIALAKEAPTPERRQAIDEVLKFFLNRHSIEDFRGLKDIAQISFLEQVGITHQELVGETRQNSRFLDALADARVNAREPQTAEAPPPETKSPTSPVPVPASETAAPQQAIRTLGPYDSEAKARGQAVRINNAGGNAKIEQTGLTEWSVNVTKPAEKAAIPQTQPSIVKETKFPKTKLRTIIEQYFPGITERLGAVETRGRGDAAERAISAAEHSQIDHARFIARVFQMDQAGELKREDIGSLVGISTRELQAGDTFQIDGEFYNVDEISPDGVVVSTQDESRSLPIGGGESVRFEGDKHTFTLPHEVLIPVNQGSVTRGGSHADLIDFPPVDRDTFLSDIPDGEANPWEQGQKEIEGKRFPARMGAALMETGRLLAVNPRYKKLRGRMAGVFRYPPGIVQLRDVRWIRTLSHEVGHAIDYRLNGNKFPSSIKARFRDLGLTEREARAELKAASRYIRPFEGEKWSRYRASHPELMADLVSLYLLDAAKAEQLAPNMTRALRGAIAGNSLIQNAVNTVLDPEHVPAGETVNVLDRLTTLPDPTPPPISRPDPAAREEIYDLVRQTSREMEEHLTRVHEISRKWREGLSESEREDIAAFIEKIGNVNVPGDTFQAVEKRLTPAMRQIALEYRYEQELNRQEANKLFDEAGSGPEAIHYIADYLPHLYRVSREKALEFAGRWRKNTPHTKERKFPTMAEAVEAGLEPITTDIAYLYEKAAENNMRAALSRRFAKRLRDYRGTSGEPLMVQSLEEAGADWVKIDHPVLRHTYARPNPSGDGLILGEGSAYVHPSIVRPVKVLLDRPFSDRISKALHAINSAGKSMNVGFSFFHEVALFESSSAVNMRFLNPLRGVLIGPFEAQRRGLGFRPMPTHRAGHLLGRERDKNDVFGMADAVRHGLHLRRSASTDYARGWMEKQLRSIENMGRVRGGLLAGGLLGATAGRDIGGVIGRTAARISTGGVPVVSDVAGAVGRVIGSVPGIFPGAATGAIAGVAIGPRRIRKLYEAYQRHLWDSVHVGLKVFSYHTLAADLLQNMPAGLSVRDAKEVVASYVNDAYGGQEFLELPSLRRGHRSIAEPATIRQRQIVEAAVFAPDWTWSNVRIAGRAIVSNVQAGRAKIGRSPDPEASVDARLGRQYWRNMLITLTAFATILQQTVYHLFGDDDEDMKQLPWQNEPGREWDIDITPLRRAMYESIGMEAPAGRYYIHAGKQAREVLRYFDDFPDGLRQNIENKASVSVRMVLEQFEAGDFPMPWEGTVYRRELDGYNEIVARGMTAAENFKPFSFSSNNFAFSLPMAKGMTPFKAIRYYEDALVAYADPSWWSRIRSTPEQRETAVLDLIRQVDEAAESNGIEAGQRDMLFTSARAKVRSEYYDKFFAAMEKQDWTELDRVGEVLLRLGATDETIRQSAERQGIDLNELITAGSGR